MTRSPLSHLSGREGISLVEVLVAVAILAFGLLPVMNLLVWSTRSTAMTSDRAQAWLVGRNLLDHCRTLSLPDLHALANDSTLLESATITESYPTVLAAFEEQPLNEEDDDAPAPELELTRFENRLERFHRAVEVVEDGGPSSTMVRIIVSWTSRGKDHQIVLAQPVIPGAGTPAATEPVI